MKIATLLVVTAGSMLALLLGVERGFDPTAVVILVLIALVGALAVAAASITHRGAIGPVSCSACGGLASRNAPYCKHCGAHLL